MIRQKIVLPEYGDWEIYIYCAITHYAADEIMDKLREIGIGRLKARQAYKNLSSGKLNTGLCYSNYRRRQSVVVIAKTTTAAQFVNSWHHELEHLEKDIGAVFNLDPNGEDIAYLSGEIAMEMFPKIRHLLCDGCRKKKGL